MPESLDGLRVARLREEASCRCSQLNDAERSHLDAAHPYEECAIECVPPLKRSIAFDAAPCPEIMMHPLLVVTELAVGGSRRLCAGVAVIVGKTVRS